MISGVKFFICSVGDPEKDYDEENLERIIEKKAFILHKDTKRKGAYSQIQSGDILLLKFKKRLIGYGRTTGINTLDLPYWNLAARVEKWVFKEENAPEVGISYEGMNQEVLNGGQYDTVKEISKPFAMEKIREINSTSELYKDLKERMDIPTSEDTWLKSIVQLLMHKKQIILQGPPGTGKTFSAKQIAKKLISTDATGKKVLPDLVDLSDLIAVGEQVPMRNDRPIEVVDVTNRSVKVSYREGKFFSLRFDRILNAIITGDFKRKGGDAYLNGLAEFLLKKWLAKDYLQEYTLDEEPQIKLIQFHPAYSYEDLVRGITARTVGSAVEYITENRILAEFAQAALQNYENSRKDVSALSRELWIKGKITLFAEKVQDCIDTDGKYPINEKVSIYAVEEDAFRYKGDVWAVGNMQRMKFADIILAYLADAKSRQDIKAIDKISGRAREHASYDFKVLQKFREFLTTEPVFMESTVTIPEKQYVLIIDEINRANLPAVLGELIYALEYRGEPVDSMYSIDGDRQLILPPNLFIIGTMNTADRSVSHIDYAIRRRFAFVDVLPSKAPVHPFAQKLFAQISGLFISNFDSLNWSNPSLVRSEHLAIDFRPEDVWIGHSYFMSDKQEDGEVRQEFEVRLKYEILPLLREYVKDGLLLSSAVEIIDSLHA